MATWNRTRIAGSAAAVVLSFWVPVAIDQAYFRYNAYVLPIAGLAAALLYAGLILTSNSVSARIRSFHHNFGVAHPLEYFLVASVAGGILILLLGGGELYAIRKSQKHIAELKRSDNVPQRPTTAVSTPPTVPSTDEPTKQSNRKKYVGKSKANTAPVDPQAMPPVQINSAPNGIAIGGGTVTNPTVINNGPPEPKITWYQQPGGPNIGGNIGDTVLTITVDHSMEIPAFSAVCSAPCMTREAMTLGISRVQKIGWGPNKIGIVFYEPRPLGAGVRVQWFIQPRDGKP